MGDCALFVGLGNPGIEYERSRHNLGFMILDALAEANASFSFKKISSLAEILSFTLHNEKIILAKPLTYMNLSGRAVRFLIDFYKIVPSDVFVFHDDIDLSFLRVKVKKGGGSGGHNGLRSIDELIGCEYWRIRIGIGRPTEKSAVASYVLHPFEKEKMTAIAQMSKKVSDNFSLLLTDPKAFEQKLNISVK